MRTCLVFAIVFLANLSATTAQQQAIDSLLQVLPATKEDTNRVKVLRELASQYASVDPAQARTYADSALSLSRAISFPWGIYSAMYTLGVIDYYTGNHEQAIALADEALAYFRESKDLPSEVKALNFLSAIYQNQNQVEKALEYANASLELAGQLGNKGNIATALYSIGLMQKRIGNEGVARANLLKALALFEAVGDINSMATVCQGLTTVTKGAEALNYAKRALSIFEDTGNVQGQAHGYSSLATIYYEGGRNEEALEAYLQSLSLCEQINFTYGMASLNSNIGLLLTEMNRFEEAYNYLMESKALANSLNTADILITTYRGLANYYAHQQDPRLVQETVDSLMALQDTLYSRERADLLIQSETKYQLKEKENQMNLEVSRQKRLRNIILLSALSAILGLVALFQYFRNRQRLRQKEAELALQLKKAEAEQLRELDQLKSNFFANISHEFRTPLTLILGPLQQMRSGALQGNPQPYVDIMYRNGKRLQALINQLLDLSKLESQKMQLRPEPGDIIRFIRQLAGSVESWAEQKQIDYQLQLPEQPLWVAFDRDKLEKILINLLSNALKFTPNGGSVTLKVEAFPEDRQQVLAFEVADSGKGIPASELDKIFQRFYHSPETPDGTASSGIGLALARELVELHGGAIRVESEEGKGTAFTVRLPFKNASPVEEVISEVNEAPANTGPAGTVETDSSSPKDAPIVLIVEDNPDVRLYIKGQLSGLYQILEAENGRQGLELALNTIPDLVITDLMMPEMDGTTLARQLKSDERSSHIPVVMLTAKAERSDRLEGLETGADDYLIKPFDAEELQARVRNLIEQRRRLRDRFTRESLLSPQNIASTSVDERFLARLMEAIEERIDDEGLSVEGLSREVGMSRSQLHRKVTALTGKSPNVLLRTFRLQRARQLLEQQAGNTTEVAFMVGFSSLAYFSKCFKEEFGLTPTEAAKG
ncbi:MAG: response regulator [Phaeodactylibacter sp.]|nr:response regulator [Phaeodactylibacter sp.]